MKHSLVPLLAASSLCLVVGLLGHRVAALETNGSAAATLLVEAGSIGGQVRLGGSVEPEQVVNLTAQMPGDVSFVAGQEGDAFKTGDILISLDTKSLLAKREQVLSQIASADAGYRNALVQYQNELANPNGQTNSMLGGAPGLFSMFADPARAMMGQGSPGMERDTNLFAQSTQIQTALNGLKQAQAALAELDESLKNANSTAPFDGLIVNKMVERGDIVQPGMPLVSFADVTRLQIHVEVPTRLLRAIEPGAEVMAHIDGEPAPVPVKVDRIFPTADAGGHTTTVKFALPPGTLARPGMYAEVILADPKGTGTGLPLIPVSALTWRGSLPAVFKVTDDGQVKLRLIRIEEPAIGERVRVISGLQVGDRILADPAAAPGARP